MRKNFGTKSWFYPLPVLIIGTYNEDGTADAMNAAWGGLYDADKVVLCLSAGHKTTANIQARGAFTVSFADAAHVVPSDYVGIVSANTEPGKMEKSGFHVTKSESVDAPLIDELPVALECKLLKVNEDVRLSMSAWTKASWTGKAILILPSSAPFPLNRPTMPTMCWAKKWATPSGTAQH